MAGRINKKVRTGRKLYLTKRVLARIVQEGFDRRAAQAMENMGYVVVAQDGFVVKKYQDGRVEQISKIVRPELPDL